MNKDLVETVNELGPAYRELVCKIQQPETAAPSRREEVMFCRGARRGVRGLAAALALALVAAAVLCATFSTRQPGGSLNPSREFSQYTLALDLSPQALDRICAEQLPDGSWGNDFLTVQNASALRDCKEAQVSYKRALRYLRSKGLKPLSRQELDARRVIARFQ